MLLRIYLTVIICGVLIVTGAGSAEDVMRAVGGEVSFTPAKFTTQEATSITWKQKASDSTVKVIEWDFEDGLTPPPNPRFEKITNLDEKTGQITIINLKIEHSGLYTFDINSKEQEQRFNLKVMERVPKPVITTEKSGNSDVVYLRCEYNENIIWKNASGIIPNSQKGDRQTEIVVENKYNPKNFYTCTLKNDVSEETSDPLYEKDLFKGRVGVFSSTELTNMKESNAGLIAGIVIPILLLLLLPIAFVVYKHRDSLRKLYIQAPQGEEMNASAQNNAEKSLQDPDPAKKEPAHDIGVETTNQKPQDQTSTKGIDGSNASEEEPDPVNDSHVGGTAPAQTTE